jgi:hypothetical protein
MPMNLESIDSLKMEANRKSFVYVLFINIIAFWAMLKFVFLRYILRIDREAIRNKYYGSFFVDRFSKADRKARINATNWRALDELYNYYDRENSYTSVENWFNKYWMKIENAQALRNRARQVKQAIHEELENKLNKSVKNKIRILSIASGSAQPLLEAIAGFDKTKQKSLKVSLLDADKSALDHSKFLADKYGLLCDIICFNNRTTSLNQLFSDNSFDLIEMVGFLDYRTHEKAVSLIQKIKGLLANQGVFITGNIMPNREKFFLDWVLLWPMIYRSEKQLKRIMLESGFKEDNTKIIIDPLRVHQLAVCRV